MTGRARQAPADHLAGASCASRRCHDCCRVPPFVAGHAGDPLRSSPGQMEQAAAHHRPAAATQQLFEKLIADGAMCYGLLGAEGTKRDERLRSVEISSQRFSDIDAFRAHLQGWDTGITQLSRGPLNLGRDQIVFDDLLVARLQVDGHCADVSSIEPGVTCFVVTLVPALRTCGLDVGAGSIVIMRAGREDRSKVPEHVASCEIVLANPLVDQLGRSNPIAWMSATEIRAGVWASASVEVHSGLVGEAAQQGDMEAPCRLHRPAPQ